MTDDQRPQPAAGIDRRRFIRRVTAGGAALWVAPAVTSLYPAGAAETPPDDNGEPPPPPPPSCDIDPDIRNWIPAGYVASGWTQNESSAVGPDTGAPGPGPAFLISPEDCPIVTFSGTIRVATTGDDDIIGLVMGHVSPTGGCASCALDTIVFDWKQTSQTLGSGNHPEGAHLFRAQGTVGSGGPAEEEFWSHDTATILDSDTGTGRGWNDNSTYNYTVTYTPTSIQVAITGDVNMTLNAAGSFPSGRIGFMTYSQSNVNFTLSSLTSSG